jgi:hypothetical protein
MQTWATQLRCPSVVPHRHAQSVTASTQAWVDDAHLHVHQLVADHLALDQRAWPKVLRWRAQSSASS